MRPHAIPAGEELAHKAADVGASVTYGVHYANDTLVFYRDGAAVRTVAASCLAGASLNVVLSHELNPRLGGVNNGSTWERQFCLQI